MTPPVAQLDFLNQLRSAQTVAKDAGFKSIGWEVFDGLVIYTHLEKLVAGAWTASSIFVPCSLVKTICTAPHALSTSGVRDASGNWGHCLTL